MVPSLTICCWTSGSAITALSSGMSLATTSFGVPAGTDEHHPSRRRRSPEAPASAIGGISGADGDAGDRGDAERPHLAFPDQRQRGDGVENSIGTWPAMTSVSAGALPL